MEKFRIHRGVVAPLLQGNISTDTIIPSREITQVSKTGLSSGLFANWRYRDATSRQLNPQFILNSDSYANASILLCGTNFGCGSSREQAVWALWEFGIRALIAPSFGSIFYSNCLHSGLLPIILPENEINVLANSVVDDPQHNLLVVNLLDKFVESNSGHVFKFDINETHRQMLLDGLDKIDQTLQRRDSIEAFEVILRKSQPWMFLDE